MTPLPLDGLDAVNWADLKHAYGSAKDVPGLLRDLASRDEERGEKAIHSFYGNIWHQGTVYEATSFAVPFLLQIVADEANPLRSDTLMLLSAIAHGSSYHDVHREFFGEQEREEQKFQQKIRKELNWVEGAKSAVERGVPLYLSLLDNADSQLRAPSVYLVALFAPPNSQLYPPLFARLATEKEADVRTCLWLGLALNPGKTAVPDLEEALDETDDELERWAICTVMVASKRADVPPIAVETLLDMLLDPSEDLDGLPIFSEGAEDLSERMLLLLGDDARRFSALFCAALKRTDDAYTALTLWEIIGPQLFAGFSSEEPVIWDKLDQEARQLLLSLVGAEAVWREPSGSVQLLERPLQDFGLPYDREKMRALIPTTT